jgi:hypothetical protein
MEVFSDGSITASSIKGKASLADMNLSYLPSTHLQTIGITKTSLLNFSE